MELPSSDIQSAQDFELNLVPIVDCLTVLIAFLLVSASFFAIGLFDVGIASAPEPSVPMSSKALQGTNLPALLVRLAEGGGIELRLSGQSPAAGFHRQLGPAAGTATRDLDGMLAAVRQLRERDGSVREAVLGADPGVEYSEMIRAIEVLHQEMPQVFIGG